METLSVRQAALADVQNALPVFEQINDLYIQAENLNQQVMVAQAEASEANNRGGKAIALGVAGAAYFVVESLLGPMVDRMFHGKFTLAFAVISLIGIGVIYLMVRRMDTVRRKQNAQRVQDQVSVQMEGISQELYRLFNENQAVILPIPRDYRNYNAVAFFESALANGRADSMKEALNLYEEYLHRAAMELNSQLALEQSRQQSAMLANIEESSRQTAVNSGIAAGFSVLNFLSNI